MKAFLAAVALGGLLALTQVTETGSSASTVLGAAIVVALLGVLLLAGGRASAGRAVTVRGHSHGGLRDRIAVHEAGHVAAARAVGGRVRSARMDDHGGLVQAVVPDARAEVVFLLAGQAALGSSEGAAADNAAVRRTLREFPACERAAVRAAATREAQRVVRRQSGQIRRDATRMAERGRL